VIPALDRSQLKRLLNLSPGLAKIAPPTCGPGLGIPSLHIAGPSAFRPKCAYADNLHIT